MRVFREIGFEDHTAVGIDWRSPDEAAMENEEAAMECDEQATTDEDAGMLARCEPGILGALLRFILPPVTSQSRLKVANYRLVCLAHQAGIEGVANQSITQLAKRLGITKAALSYWNVKVADELGSFSTRHGKSPNARAAYKVSAVKHHAKLGHNLPSLEKREADQAS